MSEEAAPVTIKRSALPEEPWNCSACGAFIYNVRNDAPGEPFYPVAGAPEPQIRDLDNGAFPRVCRTCADMYYTILTVPGKYWDRLHAQWAQKMSRHRAAD